MKRETTGTKEKSENHPETRCSVTINLDIWLYKETETDGTMN